MRVLVSIALVVLCMSSVITARKRRFAADVQADDPLARVEVLGRVENVEYIRPATVMGECSCVCCDNEPAQPLTQPKCPNDILVAVDSSACFRDHHRRMMKFLSKLVHRVGRETELEYSGHDGSRLGLMQFSSDILFPLPISSFEDYTNPSSNRALTTQVSNSLDQLKFLGEGAFLDKALNATIGHFATYPRDDELLAEIAQAPPSSPRKVVILLTNGKSHPSVTMDSIEQSVAGLRQAGITVIPISVTRECHYTPENSGMVSDEWNEGLCPDPVVMNKLASVGRESGSTFMEMKSQDTLPNVLNELKDCFGS